MKNFSRAAFFARNPGVYILHFTTLLQISQGKKYDLRKGGGNKYDFQCNIQTPAGTGADPIWSESESAPGPQTSGAAEKKWRLRNTGAQSHFVQNHTSRGHFPTPRSFKELSKKRCSLPVPISYFKYDTALHHTALSKKIGTSHANNSAKIQQQANL